MRYVVALLAVVGMLGCGASPGAQTPDASCSLNAEMSSLNQCAACCDQEGQRLGILTENYVAECVTVCEHIVVTADASTP
jgi:hypothetical protein